MAVKNRCRVIDESHLSCVTKRNWVGMVFSLLIVALVSLASAGYQACGWDEIRACLLDGDGSEFIEPVAWTPPDGTEFEQVVAAANYVANSLTYAPDPADCGDVWTSANSIGGTGDCEEFAILLTSLIRFSIGVPADRVWVQAGFITQTNGGGTSSGPPIAGHAYVGYRGEHGVWHIEPQWGHDPYLVAYRGSKPSVTHWSQSFAAGGESSMLMFNDAWVRGGGPYLAGPRNGNEGDASDLPGQAVAALGHRPTGSVSSPLSNPGGVGMETQPTELEVPAVAASTPGLGRSPSVDTQPGRDETIGESQPSDVAESIQEVLTEKRGRGR